MHDAEANQSERGSESREDMYPIFTPSCYVLQAPEVATGNIRIYTRSSNYKQDY